MDENSKDSGYWSGENDVSVRNIADNLVSSFIYS